jgi:drug/metabolite transporter (DMT)-like permease
MSPGDAQEHRLAIVTGWGFLGGFGICLILSGFAEQSLVAGLGGFAILVGAFVVHVIVNSLYRTGFTQPQIALGLGAFTLGVLCFIASVLFNPGFREVDIAIGLVGFSALAATFVIYIIVNYGVRESYAMVYRLHVEERRRT